MGPRGHRLDRTEKPVWVLTLACPTEGDPAKEPSIKTGTWRSFERRFSSLSVCRQVAWPQRPRRSTGDGQTRAGCSKKQAKAIKIKNSALSLPFSTTCSHSPFVPVCVSAPVCYVRSPFHTSVSCLCCTVVCCVLKSVRDKAQGVTPKRF